MEIIKVSVGSAVRFGARSPNDLLFRSSKPCTHTHTNSAHSPRSPPFSPRLHFRLSTPLLFLLLFTYHPFNRFLFHTLQVITYPSALLPRTFFPDSSSPFQQLMLFISSNEPSRCSSFRFTPVTFNPTLELILLSRNTPFNCLLFD